MKYVAKRQGEVIDLDADGKNGRTLLIIGADVAKWRIAHGYTQKTLARAVGIHWRNIQKLEQGRRMPPWPEIYNLKNFMGVDDDFFATSDMLKNKPTKRKGPYDLRVNRLIGRILAWHDETDDCKEKEFHLRTLEGIIDLLENSKK